MIIAHHNLLVKGDQELVNKGAGTCGQGGGCGKGE